MNGETVGRSLREAREARKLSLEQISQATYIRLRYLQAMEAGDFDSLPSQTQTRGFLRTVANFLKIDPEPLLAAIEEGAADLSTQEIEPTESSSVVRIASAAPQPAQDASGQEEIRSIFIGIGQQLQNRRELLGLSIEDVERHTRLRSHYLKSLESGDLDKLPSPVQGRGMLNNYAIFLGVDPEPLLLRFADGLQARLALRQGRPTVSQTGTEVGGVRSPTPQSASQARSRSNLLHRLFSIEIVFVSITALALIAFSIWGVLRISDLVTKDQTIPTAPSIAEVLLATSTLQPAGSTLTPTPPSQQIPAAQPGAESTDPAAQAISSGKGVQLYITVYQRGLVRVVVDGEEQFLARVLPGTAYTFNGKDQIEILTSNGAALQVFFNGVDQGLMGLFGQVVYRIYTSQGIITPTPTITQTPTPTQIPTATPEPTRTISPNLPEAPTVPVIP